MTLTIELPPETEHKLLVAAATGKDVNTLVREAVEEKLQSPPSFTEVLAPVHDDFRRSGMSEAELDTLLQETLDEVRAERRQRRGQAS